MKFQCVIQNYAGGYMTIQECYRNLGGDFNRTEKRLPGAGMIRRFLLRFPQDPTFSSLCQAMREGDRAAAFRCAHTLKGVCANLGLDRLLDSSGRLTEALRAEGEGIPPDAAALLEQVRQDYALTVSAIRSYSDSESVQ